MKNLSWTEDMEMAELSVFRSKIYESLGRDLGSSFVKEASSYKADKFVSIYSFLDLRSSGFLSKKKFVFISHAWTITSSEAT